MTVVVLVIFHSVPRRKLFFPVSCAAVIIMSKRLLEQDEEGGPPAKKLRTEENEANENEEDTIIGNPEQMEVQEGPWLPPEVIGRFLMLLPRRHLASAGCVCKEVVKYLIWKVLTLTVERGEQK